LFWAFLASHSLSDGWRADPNCHVENFKIINAMTNEEYR
jgi:hypothetical protein